jgi:hypothetical protein
LPRFAVRHAHYNAAQNPAYRPVRYFFNLKSMFSIKISSRYFWRVMIVTKTSQYFSLFLRHLILLVAAGLDASAERIINYLAQKQIGINAAFFNYCELSDKK